MQSWTAALKTGSLHSLGSHSRQAGVALTHRPHAFGHIAGAGVIIVHSSFDRFEGFRGSLGGAIQTLQDAVGPEGALLMLRAPTAPGQ
jgi:hypothetical protein